MRHSQAVWDGRFMEMADLVGSWSKDQSTKVGAVIVDCRRRVLSLGYNGLPRGVEDTPERLGAREVKYPMVVHAETNAILNATGSVYDATLYCTRMPCAECTGIIIQAGILRVVHLVERDFEERWADSIALARSMLEEAQVKCDAIDSLGEPM